MEIVNDKPAIDGAASGLFSCAYILHLKFKARIRITQLNELFFNQDNTSETGYAEIANYHQLDPFSECLASNSEEENADAKLFKKILLSSGSDQEVKKVIWKHGLGKNENLKLTLPNWKKKSSV